MEVKIRAICKTGIGTLCLCVFVALTIVLALWLQFNAKHKGNQFIRVVEDSEFYLAGALAFWGSEHTWHSDVIEIHEGTNYSIIYPEKSYLRISGHYYVEEGTKGRVPVSVPEEEQDELEEIFGRASVLSGFDFSSLEYSSSYPEKIMDISTLEPILCDCEEYRVKDTEYSVRLYFRGNKLYAVQTKPDTRWIFYVSFISDSPQGYAGLSWDTAECF